jgi:hypothetical protein
MSHVSRFRLHFRLRSLFLATTFIALALGIWLQQHRQSAAIAAWDLQLRNLICEKLAAIPAHTRAVDPPDSSLGQTSPPRIDAEQLPRLDSRQLSSLTYWTPTITLDVSDALRTESPAQVAERLLRHYESGLELHAMVRKSIQLCSTGPQSTEPSSVWLSADPRRGAMITIDVRVDELSRTATIQYRHIARPSVGPW